MNPIELSTGQPPFCLSNEIILSCKKTYSVLILMQTNCNFSTHSLAHVEKASEALGVDILLISDQLFR